MAARMRKMDWAQTPLGPPHTWSSAMRNAVALCLGSRMCACVYSGEQFHLIYNDAFASFLGVKHAWALMQPFAAIWPEVLDTIGALLESTLRTGATAGTDDARVIIDRSGYLEEVYCSFSYAPILNEFGHIEGIFTIIPETTTRVIAERRLNTLQGLGLATRRARTSEEALYVSAEVLARNPYDLPFGALYLCSHGDSELRLCATANIDEGHALAPSALSGNTNSPLGAIVARTRRAAVEFVDVSADMLPLPLGAWQLPARQLALLSLELADARAPRAFAVLGVNPHKRLDDEHVSWFQMLADQIGRALTETYAHQQERERIKALQVRARRVKREERLRIARDLHDTLLQSVQGMKFLLETGLDKVNAGDPTAADLLNRALAACNHAVSEGREVLSLLRSSADNPDDLRCKLSELGAELASETDLRCVVDIEGDERRIEPTVGSEITIICREAGFNAMRHAQPRVIGLRARFGTDLVIDISDDGYGISSEASTKGKPGHFGIRGMRERATLLGGQLQVHRQNSGGTLVRLTVPGHLAYLE